MCLDVCLRGDQESGSKAMDDEMHSLKENTFTLTNLPEGKKAVGGRWSYAMKNYEVQGPICCKGVQSKDGNGL